MSTKTRTAKKSAGKIFPVAPKKPTAVVKPRPPQTVALEGTRTATPRRPGVFQPTTVVFRKPPKKQRPLEAPGKIFPPPRPRISSNDD
jgi:hypothetical protein